jgi:hypothetical protein
MDENALHKCRRKATATIIFVCALYALVEGTQENQLLVFKQFRKANPAHTSFSTPGLIRLQIYGKMKDITVLFTQVRSPDY